MFTHTYYISLAWYIFYSGYVHVTRCNTVVVGGRSGCGLLMIFVEVGDHTLFVLYIGAF